MLVHTPPKDTGLINFSGGPALSDINLRGQGSVLSSLIKTKGARFRAQKKKKKEAIYIENRVVG
jgi:hypothetical protein